MESKSRDVVKAMKRCFYCGRSIQPGEDAVPINKHQQAHQECDDKAHEEARDYDDGRFISRYRKP